MKRLLLALFALGCTDTSVRRTIEDAPPDLLVVVLPAGASATPPPGLADSVVQFTEAHAVHTAPTTAMRALLTGQWPGTTSSARPNSAHSVLGLYGYETVSVLDAQQVPEDASWLTEGLEANPLARRTCLAEQLEQVSRLHPSEPDVAMFTLVVGPWCAGGEAETLTALSTLLDTPDPGRIIAVLGLTGQTDGAELGASDTRTPLWLASPFGAHGSFSGMVSAVDILSTLLPAARAVVPSDASGVDLFGVVAEGAAKAPLAVFQQDRLGTLAIRTSRHVLRVPHTALPLTEHVPKDVVLESVDGTSTEGLDPSALYTTLRSWEQQRRATSAADRMGNAAFREMLRDQGYWH